MNWLDEVKWDERGLVPVIAQEAASGDVLMFAWMNREALQLTAQQGRAVERRVVQALELERDAQALELADEDLQRAPGPAPQEARLLALRARAARIADHRTGQTP